MILITAYGKIETIVISKELKIKICNPSDKEIEELQDALEEECVPDFMSCHATDFFACR